MDFVTELPKTSNGNDTILVVVDRLIKLAHFLPFKMDQSLKKLAKLYMDKILKLLGVPTTITIYRDTRFTSHFWVAYKKLWD